MSINDQRQDSGKSIESFSKSLSLLPCAHSTLSSIKSSLLPVSPSQVMSQGKPTSRSSQDSVTSIGIGGAAAIQAVEGPLGVKLRPVGSLPSSPTYDCVVFFIYCREHDKVAVTEIISSSSAAKIYWFPFVACEGRTYNKAAAEGLAALFERRDADGTLASSLNLADCERDYFQRALVQGVKLSEWNTRLTELVAIKTCSLKCEPVNALVWQSVGDLQATCADIFWGHEYRYFIDKFHAGKLWRQIDVKSYPIEPILQHIAKGETSERGDTNERQLAEMDAKDQVAKLFQSAKLNTEMMADLYEDYQVHQYPSFYMNLPSFRIYMRKLGFSAGTFGCARNKAEDESDLLRSLFLACLRRPERPHRSRPYLDFFDVSYAAVALDPNTPTEEPRMRFLFAFYDTDGDGKLNSDEMKPLLKDALNAKIKPERLPNKMTFKDFAQAIRNSKLQQTKVNKLCRLPKHIFQVLAAKKSELSNVTAALVTSQPHKPVRNRGICTHCRIRKMKIGQHCVTIDSLGRCVEPQVIVDARPSSNSIEHQELYSMDYIFNPNSMGNMFFDYVRSRKFALQSATADQESQQNTYDQIKGLCEHVAVIVAQEPKLIKREGPAIIMGDMRGSLEALIALEMQFWRSMPVTGDNLIFLGNYTGSCGSGDNQAIEALIYLFAIKYLHPNKVILLRGIQETRDYNAKTLLCECRLRFGTELGKDVWNAINTVFEQLPYIAIVNEAIVCVSSGIPVDGTQQSLSQLFQQLPKTVPTRNASSHTTGKDCALLQQILTNTPNKMDTGGGGGGTGFQPQPLLPNAYLFSVAAFQKFMSLNKFSYMVRSNEFVMEGFELCFSGRIITIVSNSVAKTKTAVAIVTHPSGDIQLAEC